MPKKGVVFGLKGVVFTNNEGALRNNSGLFLGKTLPGKGMSTEEG